SVVVLLFVAVLIEALMPYLRAPKYETLPTASLVSYNFTQYGVEYLINDRWRDFVQGDVANGNNVILMSYVPGKPGAPIKISWRYVTGEYQDKYSEGSN